MNQPFTFSEFLVALNSSIKSSPGLDSITYEFIRRLPNTILDKLLAIFNEMFLKSKFRRGRSALDAVAHLALDIKGAFSAIFPYTILEELINLRAPSRIINFIGHMISQKNLFFSINDLHPRVSGVGIPQGGVLSPFLFSLALRSIMDVLDEDVDLIMYADDILLYTSSEDLEEAKERITDAFIVYRIGSIFMVSRYPYLKPNL